MPDITVETTCFVHEALIYIWFLSPILTVTSVWNTGETGDVYLQITFSLATFLLTSNDIIAGNGRVLKVYVFIMWLNRFAKLVHVNSFFCYFLLMYHIATPTIGYLLIHVVFS